MKLIDHVRGKVRFSFYKAGYLYYKTESGLEFPIPVSEANENSAIFLAEDKAVYFMRWIRKYLGELQTEAAEHGNQLKLF
jgi:hypothetical protein